MDLVLLIGVSVVAALAAGVSARRAVLGNRMDSSFDLLKVRTRQNATFDDVVIRPAPVRRLVSIKPAPIANNEGSLAEVIPARVGHIPLHSRRAS
jgi:hypothetical protein